MAARGTPIANWQGMHIAQLEPPHAGQQGDHVYRTVQPCRALGELDAVATISGNWLSPAMREACAHADVLVLCKAVDPDLLPLLHQRRNAGLVTVFEINDDFTDVQAWNPTGRFYARDDNRSLLYQLARLCDGIQFSSRHLQSVFGGLGGPQSVFDNHLWEMPALGKRRRDRVTLGWAGSYGHREDLASIVPVIREAMARHPKLHLAIMGDRRLQTLFRWAPAKRFKFHPQGSLASYHTFVAGLDIGLAPLLDTGFNRGRSDVKYLEYAAHGVAPLCARLAPYADIVEGENGLTWDSQQSLSSQLERLLDSAELREQLGLAARATVETSRLERHHAAWRLAFYADLFRVASSRRQADSATRNANFARAMQCGQPGHHGSTYVELELSGAALHLYNGLLSQATPAVARGDFRAAVAAAPGDYLPRMHLGRMLAPRDAIGQLQRATAIAPDSCASHWLLAHAHGQLGRTAEAGDNITKLLSVAPDFAPAHDWLGRRALASGDVDAAEAHMMRAVDSNPYFRPASRALCGLWMEAGALEAVEALMDRSDGLEGPQPVDDFLRARLHDAQGGFERSRDLLEKALSRLSDDTDGRDERHADLYAAILPLLARAHAHTGNRQRAAELLTEIRLPQHLTG